MLVLIILLFISCKRGSLHINKTIRKYKPNHSNRKSDKKSLQAAKSILCRGLN